MANGSSHEGPARADRLREQFARNAKMRQDALAKEAEANARDLPSYRESDSEITANAQGLHAKGIPRFAWWLIGVGIMVFIAAAGVAIVMVVVR